MKENIFSYITSQHLHILFKEIFDEFIHPSLKITVKNAI